MPKKRCFVCYKDDGNPRKYWQCWVEGKNFIAQWGSWGEGPTGKSWPFQSEGAAREKMEMMIREKLRGKWVRGEWQEYEEVEPIKVDTRDEYIRQRSEMDLVKTVSKKIEASSYKSRIHQNLIADVKKITSFFPNRLLVNKQNGVGLIQVFSESGTIKGELNKFKIAYADMLLLDEEENPLLVIEPESSSSPKTFGRSIPVFAIAKEIIVRTEKFKIEKPLYLLIVIPDSKDREKKTAQLKDLRIKLKKVLRIEQSSLNDFSICQISNLERNLSRMLKRK
ncbi:WGR domain-containing protein [Acidobacteriota bacterium]